MAPCGPQFEEGKDKELTGKEITAGEFGVVWMPCAESGADHQESLVSYDAVRGVRGQISQATRVSCDSGRGAWGQINKLKVKTGGRYQAALYEISFTLFPLFQNHSGGKAYKWTTVLIDLLKNWNGQSRVELESACSDPQSNVYVFAIKKGQELSLSLKPAIPYLTVNAL